MVPGQKLKVKVPKKADMEKRCFIVSIPMPKIKEPTELRENNFPKEFKEALYVYSFTYEDWCVAEGMCLLLMFECKPHQSHLLTINRVLPALFKTKGEHNESLPKAKQKPFKPHQEKLNKFDDMIDQFPKNLATPIDVHYLRKIVRQEKSNRARREKRQSGGAAAAVAAAVAAHVKQEESEVTVPQKGNDFSSVVFDGKDFGEK